MFYYPSVLQRHTGRFATIWLAATRGTKIMKREYLKVNVIKTCEDIIAYVLVQVQPSSPGGQRPRFSLYLSSQLGYGVVCVYHKQCDYLIDEIKLTLERLHRSHAQMRIDLVLPNQPAGLLLPDHLSMMEALEDAPDPFFGIMDMETGLPSPMNIPQVRRLLEIPSPERRRMDHTPPRPRTRKPAPDEEFRSSPERITLIEEEPMKMPEVECERDLQEITDHELKFIMAEEEPPLPSERQDVLQKRGSDRESVEKERAPELDVSIAPLSPASRMQEEVIPELDTVIPLDELTGEPVIVPPAPEFPVEVTPAQRKASPPPPIPASPVAQRILQSPPLELADIYDLPGRKPPRRSRQLSFIDQVTQIPRAETEQLLEDVHAHCQARPPVELPHKKRKTPAELLDNPTYDRWMPPELCCLWSRCARIERVDYASLEAGAAAEQEGELGVEDQRKMQQESVSELEAVREEEQVASHILSAETFLEISEEERSRVLMITPEERRATVETEEFTLPTLFEQPEPMMSEPQGDREEEITPEFVRRMLQPYFEQFGETDFETLVPYTYSHMMTSKIFFCCLVLSSKQVLRLEQEEPFHRIMIKPGPRFDQ
ncbi:meiotic recombination protein REC8 homolog [Ambystoma mexicanum]|uniref:meiotic recombination protein REC8 homolog n=1 Tax=Ambystoma mexicanum TaxID=8296 RepID=UPI0037E82FAF